MNTIQIRLKRDARTSKGRLLRGMKVKLGMAEAAALIAGGHAELVKDQAGAVIAEVKPKGKAKKAEDKVD